MDPKGKTPSKPEVRAAPVGKATSVGKTASVGKSVSVGKTTSVGKTPSARRAASARRVRSARRAKSARRVASAGKRGERGPTKIDPALLAKHKKIYISCGVIAVLSIVAIIVLTIKYLALRRYRQEIDYPFKRLRESLATSAKEPQFLINKPKDVSAQVKLLPTETEKAHQLLGERKKQYKSLFYKTARGTSGPWRFHGKSLYYFSKGEKNWTNAENFCISRGTHLASILDNAEQNFISSKVQHASWIGLKVENEEGKWRWSDGSRLVKEYWSEDQPSNAKVSRKSNQDCAVIVPSLTYRNWNDSNCHKLYRWVCKESLDLGEA